MTTATTSSAAPGTQVASLTVLLADALDPRGVDALEAAGCRVIQEPGATPESLVDLVRGHDPQVVVVRSTKVPAAVIDAADRLALIVRAGAGYDNVDLDAASARGIFVANCPGKNAAAVAELAVGLMIACDRGIAAQTAELRGGTWGKKRWGKAGRGLAGRTLGVVGLGRIGHEIVKRAKAFDMDVVVWSRSLTGEAAEAMGVRRAETPKDVAMASDVVSISVAATPETLNLVDAGFLGAMKDGATLINTSRGSVVDEAALADAIRTKGIRAGLDVWKNQPAPADTEFSCDLVDLDGVIGTHHCGASTAQAQEAVAAETVRIVRAFAATGEVPNCVNRQAASEAACMLVVRHLNRPGVLAAAFRILGEANINIEEMENVIYRGKQAAIARIQLDRVPADEIVASVRSAPHVISVELSSV
ncbi:MAG: phosphoglycerate dehydrogenase [Phycisphaerales bacterium]